MKSRTTSVAKYRTMLTKSQKFKKFVVVLNLLTIDIVLRFYSLGRELVYVSS